MDSGEKPVSELKFKALGTDVFLRLVFEKEIEREKALKSFKMVRGIFSHLEKTFSRFDPESELNNLNKNLGSWKKASPEMIYLAKRAIYYHKKSQRLFDPRIINTLCELGYQHDFYGPDFPRVPKTKTFVSYEKSLEEDLKIEGEKIIFWQKMDLAGIAKGYIIDQTADFLKNNGWSNFLLDAGGDMRIEGLNPRREKWKISLEGIPEKVLLLGVTNVAIATSGTTRRQWKIGKNEYHHLINPRNPNNFSFFLNSVTALDKRSERADFLAKTLFLLGVKEGKRFSQKFGIRCVFHERNGNVWISPEMKKNILKPSSNKVSSVIPAKAGIQEI